MKLQLNGCQIKSQKLKKDEKKQNGDVLFKYNDLMMPTNRLLIADDNDKDNAVLMAA